MIDKFFKTQYRDRTRFRASHGDRIHKLYGAVFDDKGRVQLEEKGEESLYDHIQSFAESVDIHVILKRFANGEVDVLSKVQGFYGDFTGLPTNYAQLLNTVNDGQQFFDSLPVDVRAKFGHSFNEFMTCLCDGSIVERMGFPPAGTEPSSDDPDPSPAE